MRSSPAFRLRRPSYTEMFGYQAIEMILNGYKEIAANGQDARMPLRKDFLLASNYAGIAFGNAGCAAVHATSYPLGGTLSRTARRGKLLPADGCL